MKAFAAACVFLALLACPQTASGRVGARAGARLQQPEIATGMAGLEGVACTDDEHKRYQTIVCKIERACGCADTTCELDWCSSYVHEWKKDFGACLLKGCP
mmetsp:Transcript_98146/g.277917  ORF Transcript_98146/g.277917 Transcript_98146/m.277917 type:complete len:101 (+) Transcript_98146:64-366(+)